MEEQRKTSQKEVAGKIEQALKEALVVVVQREGEDILLTLFNGQRFRVRIEEIE